MQKKIENTLSLDALPEELWLHSLKFLNKKEMGNARLACQFFKRLSEGKTFGFFYPPVDYSQLIDQENNAGVIVEEIKNSYNQKPHLVSLSNNTVVYNDITQLLVITFHNDSKYEVKCLKPQEENSRITALVKMSGQFVICSYNNGHVRVWDCQKGECKNFWLASGTPPEKEETDLLACTKEGIIIYGKKQSLYFFDTNKNISLPSLDLSTTYDSNEFMVSLCVNEEGQIITLTNPHEYYQNDKAQLYIWNRDGTLVAQKNAIEFLGKDGLLQRTGSCVSHLDALKMIVSMDAPWNIKLKIAACKPEETEKYDCFTYYTHCRIVEKDIIALSRHCGFGAIQNCGVTLWNIESGKVISKFSDIDVDNFLVMPDKRILALCGYKGNNFKTYDFKPVHYIEPEFRGSAFKS